MIIIYIVSVLNGRGLRLIMATSLTSGVLCGKALKQVRAHTLEPEERAYIVYPNRGRSYSHFLSLVL